MRTPITYYGGKQQLASRIVAMIPPHRIYCEPFFGGGAVFFAKPKSYLEVINDKNDRLITFYEQCQNNFENLNAIIQRTLHCERQHKHAKDIYHKLVEASNLEIAWAVWLVTNASFSASIYGGWKWCNGSSGSHTGVFMSAKRSDFNEKLHKRVSEVQISCRDALDVIRQRDSPDTVFYLDPPYPGACQGHYRGYTMKEFADMLEVLSHIKGKFILSNYWSQTLRYYVAVNGWNVETVIMPLKIANFNNNRDKRTKTEIIITNFKQQPTLF